MRTTATHLGHNKTTMWLRVPDPDRNRFVILTMPADIPHGCATRDMWDVTVAGVHHNGHGYVAELTIHGPTEVAT